MIIAAIGVIISLLGHATILRVQKVFTYVFGALTVVFIALEWGQIDWHKVSHLPSGSLAGVIGGISIIMAGLGIGYRPKPLLRDTLDNCILYGDLTAALYAQGFTGHF